MKTSELTGVDLDYWVAKAESLPNLEYAFDGGPVPFEEWVKTGYSPSTNWAQGGPLIEKYRINLVEWSEWTAHIDPDWSSGELCESKYSGGGETPLIAAMRAIVRSKFGADVPDEK